MNGDISLGEVDARGGSRTRLTGFFNRPKGAVLPNFSTLGRQTTINGGLCHDVKVRHSGKFSDEDEYAIQNMVADTRSQLDAVIDDIERNWIKLSQKSKDYLGKNLGYEARDLEKYRLSNVQRRLKLIAGGLNSDKLEIKLKDVILDSEFNKQKDGHGLLVKLVRKIYRTARGDSRRKYPKHMYVDHGAHANVFSESSRKTSIKLAKSAVTSRDVGALLRAVEKNSVGDNHFQIKREKASVWQDRGPASDDGSPIYGLHNGTSRAQPKGADSAENGGEHGKSASTERGRGDARDKAESVRSRERSRTPEILGCL